MIIKHVWEEKDIEPGLRVSPADLNDRVLIIGYMNHMQGYAGRRRYVVIDPVDGMVYRKPDSKKVVAAFLTEYNYRPRPELRNASIK